MNAQEVPSNRQFADTSQHIPEREAYVYEGTDDGSRGSNPYWEVQEGVSAWQLVDKLVGHGVDWSNPTIQPAPTSNASGTFWGPTSVGFIEGVILTSGRAGDGGSPGQLGANSRPNNCGVGINNGGPTSDPDLQQIATGSLNNICRLEFDFIPQSGKMEFRYVFASEEYSQYANSSFNDAFGFFLTGPNPSNPNEPYEGKNIALIPFVSPPTPVTINNVNNGQRNCPNAPGGPCMNCQYFKHVSHDTIQYNGRTTILIAGAQVVPCSTYHIKLAVCDVTDAIWDSGVFLEANSFQSVGVQGTVNFQSEFIDTIAVEDCNNARIRFELDAPLDHDFVLPISIKGTAQNGIDYDTIPDTLVIEQGFTYYDLYIVPWDDSEVEIMENVKIVYNRSFCGIDLDSINIQIWDPREFLLAAREDTIVHCGDSVLLSVMADGFPPYNLVWSTGDTVMWIPGNDTIGHTNEKWVTVFNPTTYWIEGWDECQNDTVVDSIFIDVVGPTASISNDTTICLNGTATLTAYGGDSYLWSSGETTQTINVLPEYTTIYTATVIDDCDNWDTASVTVTVVRPEASAGDDVTICLGSQATLTASDGISWFWSTGQTTQSIDVNPTADECYWVTVEDICDNVASDTVCVFVNDDVQADAGPDTTICFGTEATLTATGGIEFLWSNGETTQTIIVSPGSTTTYSVVVTEGCSDEDEVTVNVDPLPSVQAGANDLEICYEDVVTLNASGADEYIWTSSPFDPTLVGQENAPNPQVVPLVSTTYYLTGTDMTTACQNFDSVSINVLDDLLSTFTTTGMSACQYDEITFDYTGNAQAGATYDWNFDGGVATGTGAGPYAVYWDTQGDKTITLKVYQGDCESDTSELMVSINPEPVVGFSVDDRNGCVPYTLDFYDNSTNTITTATFLWDFGTGDQSTEQFPSYTYPNVGDYTVTLTVYNDICEQTKSVQNYISVHKNPDAIFELFPDLTSIEDPTITFNDQSNGNPVEWIWDLGDGTIINDQNFEYDYHDTGTFTVELVIFNEFGCPDSSYKQVTINPHPRFYIPNAFNPSSTVGNETFKPVGMGIEQIRMIIYNRWGEKVFETKKLGEGWDGNINGSPAPMGTYVYHITYTNNLQQSEELSGTVTLVR